MTVLRHDVTSSYCKAIGYDPEKNEMHVEWNNGRVSIYSPVTAAEHRAVVGAESVGRAVIGIKRSKDHRYL
jgi:hypothetical protein